MATIWKFPLALADEAICFMPDGARVLAVAAQRNSPQLWAIVDPDEPLVEREFSIRGTGHPLGKVGDYVGTFMVHDDTFVFHVFEAVWDG